MVNNQISDKKEIDTCTLLDHLDVIERAGNRASIMVKQLLSIGRKKNELHFLPVNLNELINKFGKEIFFNAKTPIYHFLFGLFLYGQ